MTANRSLTLPPGWASTTKRTEPRTKINPYTREEVLVMLQKALVLTPDLYALLMCAVRAGLRLGELIGLKGKDLDFKNRIIHLERAISRGKVKPPKNGKSRKVDMSKQLTDVLRELKRKPEEWVFQSSIGTRLDRHNLGKRWREFLADAELRKIRFHDLRHTFASLHIKNNASVVYIKEQMGHSSIKVTIDIYGHLLDEGNRELADKLDD